MVRDGPAPLAGRSLELPARHTEGHDRPAARGGGRPGRSRSLRGRPDHRPGRRVSDQYPGGAVHPSPGASPPAARGRTSAAVRDALLAASGDLPAGCGRSLTWIKANSSARTPSSPAPQRCRSLLPVAQPWRRGSNETMKRAAPRLLPEGHRPCRPHHRAAHRGRRRAQPPPPQDPAVDHLAALLAPHLAARPADIRVAPPRRRAATITGTRPDTPGPGGASGR